MQIVKFCDHHLDDIVALEKECFSAPWTKAMFTEEIHAKFARYFVAEKDGRAIGYMGMHSLSGEGHITNVAVHPDYRRSGVAKALISKFFDIAKDENLEFMTLEVRASNAPAIALYESFGFGLVGVRKNYYENTEDAHLLTKFFGE